MRDPGVRPSPVAAGPPLKQCTGGGGLISGRRGPCAKADPACSPGADRRRSCSAPRSPTTPVALTRAPCGSSSARGTRRRTASRRTWGSCLSGDGRPPAPGCCWRRCASAPGWTAGRQRWGRRRGRWRDSGGWRWAAASVRWWECARRRRAAPRNWLPVPATFAACGMRRWTWRTRTCRTRRC